MHSETGMIRRAIIDDIENNDTLIFDLELNGERLRHVADGYTQPTPLFAAGFAADPNEFLLAFAAAVVLVATDLDQESRGALICAGHHAIVVADDLPIGDNDHPLFRIIIAITCPDRCRGRPRRDHRQQETRQNHLHGFTPCVVQVLPTGSTQKREPSLSRWTITYPPSAFEPPVSALVA